MKGFELAVNSGKVVRREWAIHTSAQRVGYSYSYDGSHKFYIGSDNGSRNPREGSKAALSVRWGLIRFEALTFEHDKVLSYIINDH